MSNLTEAQRRSLKALTSFGMKGFWGPRPGSNTWPLLNAETQFGDIEGETVNDLERLGMLSAQPAAGGTSVSADVDGEEVQIDLDHRWRLSPAGRTALSQPAKGDA